MVLKAGIGKSNALAYHLEEPRVGQNIQIKGVQSKFVKVVLSGAGGDELLLVILGVIIGRW